MKNVSLANATKVPFNLDGYIMHASSALEIIHLCLKPGQAMPLHTNPFDVIACLILGEVTLHEGADDCVLALYNVVEIEKFHNRGFTNTGITEAKLIILKKL